MYMRYAQYRRVSSPRQVRGASLEQQDRENRAYVARLGGSIELDYSEPGRSAYTENLTKRIAFQQMLVDAKAKSFDALIVHDLSRFARRAVVSLNIAADFERLGITVMSATEYFDLGTAAGRMTFTMLAAAAQFKSDHLSERMRSIRRSEVERGEHVGPIPVGFTRTNGILVPLTREAAAILARQRGHNEPDEVLEKYGPVEACIRAFQLYATRKQSYESICAALTTEGWRMPDGRPFTKFQIAEMLRNPVYSGRVRRKLRDRTGKIVSTQEYQGAHEAIIDLDTWHIVQSEIDRRAEKADHSHVIVSSPALLSELAHCSNCGARMWRSGDKGSYYRCSRQLTRNYLDPARDLLCNMRGVQAEIAEAHTLASLAIICSNPDILGAAVEHIAGIYSTNKGVHVRSDPQSIKELIRRLDHMYERGRYSDAEYDSKLTQLQSELKLAEAHGTGEKGGVEKAIALLSNIPSLIAKATREERHALLLEVFDVVYLTPHQVMAVRPAAAYAELLKEARERLVWWAGWGSNPRHSA